MELLNIERVIGEDVFIGSNTMLIAPVTVGNNSMTGSGSVITKDIPADDLAISRSKQKNNNNGAKKLRKILRNKKKSDPLRQKNVWNNWHLRQT